jgi:hypothetical protein
MRIIWPKVGPTGATKGAKSRIIRLRSKYPMKRSIIVEYVRWCAIYEMGRGKKRLILILKWH